MALIAYDNLLQVSPAELKQCWFKDWVRQIVVGETISIEARHIFSRPTRTRSVPAMTGHETCLLGPDFLEQVQAANHLSDESTGYRNGFIRIPRQNTATTSRFCKLLQCQIALRQPLPSAREAIR